jgi:nitrogen fixation protein NifU and related proteins
MSHLRELYQEVILDHGKNPRNFKSLPEATFSIEAVNPLCGDRLTLYVQIENNRIVDASFTGSGCAISIASASLMTEQVKDKTLAVAEQLFSDFHALLMGEAAVASLEKLIVLAGVKAYPSRVKCASLAWHALHNVCLKKNEPVSTE